MKIENLITLLEEIASVNPGIEVRLMHQSAWPFEYSIQGVTTTSAMDEDELEAERARREDEGLPTEHLPSEPEPTKEEVVYLVEGSQLGYGRKAAWNTCTC
ncbi:MAG: hypothetical protein WC326_01870 [Candidatus Delongbacteria bacterium]